MTIFAVTKKSVPWMSGLVSGLQNRARRFDSARNLKRLMLHLQCEPFFYCSPIFTFSLQKPSNILQCAIMDKVSFQWVENLWLRVERLVKLGKHAMSPSAAR